MLKLKTFFVLLAIGSAMVLTAQTGALKIGWAMESIDPGRPSLMPGYGNFRYSYGSGDPVYATVLVLENGHDAVIFASMDIISSRGILPEVLAEAAKNAPELPKDKFFINATHTHSSLGIYYSTAGVPKEFNLMDGVDVRKHIAKQLVKAAKRAWAERKPGKVAFGYGLDVTSFNRRMVYFDDLSKRPKGAYGSRKRGCGGRGGTREG